MSCHHFRHAHQTLYLRAVRTQVDVDDRRDEFVARFKRLFEEKLKEVFPGGLNLQQMQTWLANTTVLWKLRQLMHKKPSYGQIWVRYFIHRECP